MEWFNVDHQLPDTEREVRVWVDYNDGLRASGRYSNGNWFIFPNYSAPVTHWHEHTPPPNTQLKIGGLKYSLKPCPCTATKMNQCGEWCNYYPPTT